jgi:hypothetical protein
MAAGRCEEASPNRGVNQIIKNIFIQNGNIVANLTTKHCQVVWILL